ncbi:hypothetical protein ACROAK_21905 [Shewanella oncorhynchi]|uniref:hypothetical protein n=1 Tax=Shewanella oncorhynchi TaxID=2726434 RepID=UPI003D7A7579
MTIDLIAQTGLSSLPMIYYLEQLFSKKLRQYGVTGVYVNVAADVLLNNICTAKINRP